MSIADFKNWLPYAAIIILLAIILVIIWQAAQAAIQKAHLNGMKDAVRSLSHGCSRFYERENVPLPESVVEAFDMLDKALTRESFEWRVMGYLSAARALGAAMGEAAQMRGYDLGEANVRKSIHLDIDSDAILSR